MTPTVYTIGHGLLDLEVLTDNLRQHAVELVVDVRSHPSSMRAPQFNEPTLRAGLERAGIAYSWEGEALGGRPPEHLLTRAGTPDYERMAREPRTIGALDEVARRAATQRIALLCSESRPETCHRSRMLEPELESRGAAVEHILPDGSVTSQPTLFS
jgi:uncharacterized protein (DUF488 family)